MNPIRKRVGFNKAALGATLGLASVIVPAGILLASSNNRDNISISLSSAFSDAGKSLGATTNEIKNQAENISETLTNAHQQISNQYHGTKDFVEKAATYTHENSEDINYYIFSLGNLIKPTIRSLPLITRDTIIQMKNDKPRLLSLQKIYAAVKSDQWSKFAQTIKSILNSKSNASIFHNMNEQEGNDLLKIFADVQNQQIDSFLSKISDNYTKHKDITLMKLVAGNDAVDIIKRQLKDIGNLHDISDKEIKDIIAIIKNRNFLEDKPSQPQK